VAGGNSLLLRAVRPTEDIAAIDLVDRPSVLVDRVDEALRHVAS
jgi:hypothetical protein